MEYRSGHRLKKKKMTKNVNFRLQKNSENPNLKNHTKTQEKCRNSKENKKPKLQWMKHVARLNEKGEFI